MSSVSRSKGNQTVKFGHLIECNMRNVFLEKSYAKCDCKSFPRSISEQLKLSISLDYWYTVCFYCMPSWRLLKHIETILQTTFFYLILSFFKKTWSVLGGVSVPHFPHNFWRKIFLLLYSVNWPSFIIRLPLLHQILVSMCIAIVC